MTHNKRKVYFIVEKYCVVILAAHFKDCAYAYTDKIFKYTCKVPGAIYCIYSKPVGSYKLQKTVTLCYDDGHSDVSVETQPNTNNYVYKYVSKK